MNVAVEHSAFVRGQRDQQAARGLRVVGERQQILRDAVRLDVRPGEVAVPGVAAGANAGRARPRARREERQLAGVELDPDAAPLRHLVRVAEQAEAGHVGDRVRLERSQHVGRLAVERSSSTAIAASSPSS